MGNSLNVLPNIVATGLLQHIVLTCIAEADLFLQTLGEVCAGRVGGEGRVGNVFVAEKLRHRVHQQVARLRSGHVVVALPFVEINHAVPVEAATEQREVSVC